jgi:hypothetical protein
MPHNNSFSNKHKVVLRVISIRGKVSQRSQKMCRVKRKRVEALEIAWPLFLK